jgi:hypothetical protein
MATSVKNLLHIFFQEQNWKLTLLTEWPTIAGTLHDKMRIEKITEETLFIGVYQSSWLQELYLLSHVLKKSINDHLGRPYIKQLRFKHVTPTVLKNHEASKSPVKKEIILQPICLSTKEQYALTKIKDEALKQALHNFLSRCHYQKVSQ